MNDTQRQIARKLVELLVEDGYIISLWAKSCHLITNSTNIDDILGVVEQAQNEIALEIDLIRTPDQHKPCMGTINLAWLGCRPGIDITYYIPPLAQPFIDAIIDEVQDFAASLEEETAS